VTTHIVITYATAPGEQQISGVDLRVDTNDPTEALARALAFAGRMTSLPVSAVSMMIVPDEAEPLETDDTNNGE